METSTVTTTKWGIDASHSEVLFKVKHLMISTVTGSFKEFGADAELEGDDLTIKDITKPVMLDVE